MPTFRELYPQFYTNSYDQSGQELFNPSQDRPMDPSPDVSPISQYAAPMPPTRSMASLASPPPDAGNFSQRFHAVLAGQNPYDIASQMENRKALREQAKAHQQAIDVQTELLLFDKIQKADPGEREPYVKALTSWYETKGTKPYKGYIDVWKKAEADELELYKQAGIEFIKQQAIENNWTEEQVQEKTKAMLASPVAFARIHAKAMELKKLQEETKKLKNEAEEIAGFTKAVQETNAPGSPTSPPMSQPSPNPRPAPMTQPGGSQGPQMGTPALKPAGATPPEYLLTPEGKKVQQFVVNKAKSLGIDPAYAQALIDQESGWDPQAVSPTGVVGLAQVTNKTGQKYGQSPQTRVNPVVSANTGLTYFADLLKETGGDYQKALMRYNGGTDPQYVQNVERHLPKYGGVARPSTQAAASGANQQELQALQDYKARIDDLQMRIEKLAPYSTREGPKRYIEQLRATQKTLMDNRDRIEKRYETAPKTPEEKAAVRIFKQPYPTLNADQQQIVAEEAPKLEAKDEALKAKESAEATEESKMKVSSAQGLEAVLRQPISDTDRKNLRTYDAKKDDWVKIPVNWNQQKLQEAPGEIRHMVPIEGKPAEEYRNLAAAKAAAANILPELDKPEVQKEIGNIFSNPGAWLKRVKAKTGKDLPESVYKVKSELSRLQATLQRYYAGTAQTATELKTLDPFIVHMTDPTSLNAKTKMKALLDGVEKEYSTRRSFDLDNGGYVPKLQNMRPAEVEPEPPPEGPIDKLKKLWNSK